MSETKKTRKASKKLDKVSVITTFYNAEKFILDAINSVNQQFIDKDKFELEYILVDDKSEDNSRKLVEGFIEKHGNKDIEFRIIEPDENLGCGGARKFGIDNAKGDYFMFLDADDYYLKKDFVLRAYNDITSENADIVEYGMVMHSAGSAANNIVAPHKIIIEDKPEQALVALFKDNLIKFNIWCKIYNRKTIESFEYSTSRTYEDVRTIPVWISKASKIVIMPSLEINYRAATGSIIRTDMINTRVGTITAIAELFPRFKDMFSVLKAMYQRSMVDLEAVLHNHSSNDDGFNEMSKLNTYMLSFILKNWRDVTYDIAQETDGSNTNPKDLIKDIKL